MPLLRSFASVGLLAVSPLLHIVCQDLQLLQLAGWLCRWCWVCAGNQLHQVMPFVLMLCTNPTLFCESVSKYVKRHCHSETARCCLGFGVSDD